MACLVTEREIFFPVVWLPLDGLPPVASCQAAWFRPENNTSYDVVRLLFKEMRSGGFKILKKYGILNFRIWIQNFLEILDTDTDLYIMNTVPQLRKRRLSFQDSS